MGRIKLKGGALLAPVPPALVTVSNEDKTNVLTVAWTGVLATVPPKTYISVRPRRFSHGLLEKNREFVINLPSVPMAKAVDFCGMYTGAKVDKLSVLGLHTVSSEEVSVPSIEECPISLECKVTEIHPMGSHDVFVADVVAVTVDESLMNSSGKLCLEKANLLAFGHGEYYSLGKAVGQFGFSATKSEKQARQKARVSSGKTVSTPKEPRDKTYPTKDHPGKYAKGGKRK